MGAVDATLLNALLPAWPTLSAFLIASLALAVTPGPGVFYIVTRALARGRRVGLASVAGVALGNLCNALAANLGLAALFAVSSLAYSVVKYAGALYLVHLGLRALRAPPTEPTPVQAVPESFARVFRDGCMVALLNPKTTLFFAAFLPQFVSGGAAAIPQSLLLGALFVAIAAVSDSVYALTAGSFASGFTAARGVRVFGQRLGAGVLIGLGLFTAITDSRRGN